jgi:hypothetical protein
MRWSGKPMVGSDNRAWLIWIGVQAGYILRSPDLAPCSSIYECRKFFYEISRFSPSVTTAVDLSVSTEQAGKRAGRMSNAFDFRSEPLETDWTPYILFHL